LAPTPVVIPYAPRRLFLPYHERSQRFGKVVAHRRFGKTVGTLNDTIRRAAENERKDPPPRYAYIAPTFGQAKDIAWGYLKHYTSTVPEVRRSDGELWIELPHNNARIRLYGGDAYDRLRGIYLDGVDIDEPAQLDPRAWPEVIRPTLSDFKGWGTFIGTPKGRNWFYGLGRMDDGAIDPEWMHLVLKASETGILDEEELASARKMLTEEQYAQEYECSFEAAIVGAYYGREMAAAEKDNRIRSVPHERASDVFAAWDLGISDSMSIWIGQIVGREWHWINYYENSGHALDHYVDWIKALPYKVHLHYLPHDGAARELQSGKSRVQFLEERGFLMGGGDDNKCVPRHEPMDGIEAARLRFNRMYFDAEKCARGIDCLRMYRADYDDKNQVLRQRPLHDWASHGADAFRCGVMGAEETVAPEPTVTRKLDWVV
jgi:phage terminase large subunit